MADRIARGDVVTVAGGSGYAGKPRPAVVVQSDTFLHIESVTVCPMTTNPLDAPMMRIPIAAEKENGLVLDSRVMVDKVMTVPRARIGRHLGRLAAGDLARVDRALLVFLGLAG